MKFRKKPVVIEAVQWNGPEDDPALKSFAGMWVNLIEPRCITTPEGSMKITHGDWIIKGIKGEFYPCKPDIFEATYEPAK